MGNSGIDASGTIFMQNFCGGGESAGSFRHIIYQQHIPAFDFADHVHRLDASGADAVLGDDGQLRTEGIRIGARHFHPAHIRRNHS